MKKVSIVLPCYNGAETIERAVRGIINQTYRPIQFVLVNDGSTDDTEKIIHSMEKELDEAQIEFQYVPQANKGLGGAINTGLKFVTGEYLAWVDADDELLPESVEIRVNFLEDHLQYGSVSSNAMLVEEQDWNCSLGLATDNTQLNSEEDQFEHILLARSLFCAGCHLIRTSVFERANGGMDIYPARHGQNWQMLLPVYYASKHAFLNIPLYKYRVDANSMDASARKMSAKKLAQRRWEHAKIIKYTLNRIVGMTNAERRKYMRMYVKRIFEQNLDTALVQQDKVEIFKWRMVVRCMNRIPWWK